VSFCLANNINIMTEIHIKVYNHLININNITNSLLKIIVNFGFAKL